MKLGDKVRDTISGFEGTAIARVEYLNSCPRICIQGRVSDPSKAASAEYFDEAQVELIAAA